ncbi:helix-turn-helix domain-containing protein [Desulfitobacterium hafniense]|uniref:helix-turn-helix domain-containing protein n=1 Tax=Desulfitobacterium hafniense TaxID=49338 RepID=UPI000366F0CB|nr:helix-turn-helix transcriptional regulator [Desulfitobacterium hafniense]
MRELQDITLQDLLDSVGLKQRDLAEPLKLDESTVSLKLSGKRKMSLDEARIIAQCVDASLDQIWHSLNFANCKVKVS